MIRKRLLLAFADAVVVVFCLTASFLMYFSEIPSMYFDRFYSLFALFVCLKIGIFWMNGLYHRMWRYASIEDLVNIIRASVLASVVTICALYFVGARFPRQVMTLDFLMTLCLLGLMRLAFRIRHDVFRKIRSEVPAHRVIVIGAGDAGEIIIREMMKHPELGYAPVGILDDAREKQGMKIHGVEVIGTTETLNETLVDYDVKEVVIAIPTASGAAIRRIIGRCNAQGVRFTTVPGIFELIDGKVRVSQIREIRIEDLLGRETVDLDLERISSTLAGKTILVTGAGGSIGSQLCREVARFGPRLLVMVGKGENSIHTLSQEFDSSHPDLAKALVIASITDRAKMREVFRRHRPEIVFHAAAHKHVPLMEMHPDEAVKNNVGGTRVVADLAEECGVKTFVMISTDKAVYPSSVMGATKRLAEMVVLSRARAGATRFAVVRFGNVLGSRGSVVPIFMKQIREGGPVTVTHPDVERYFMTIPEASKLVIQAQAMATGGEIFLLNMGEPVKILDLAKDLIKLSGFEPGEEIKIAFTGLRQGEKMTEELLTREEGATATRHRKIFVAPPVRVDRERLDPVIDRLEAASREGDPDRARAALFTALRETEAAKSGRPSDERSGEVVPLFG